MSPIMTSSNNSSLRVSIVIPCYNRAALIGDAIESAMANGDGAEIIVVDDGSSDGSWERICSFGNRLHGFRIPNGGVSAARNFGVAQATGDYIKFLDSDDRLPPKAIRALVEAQRKLKSHQIVFGDARSIGPKGEVIDPFGYGYAGLAPVGALSRAMVLSGTMSPYLPLYPVAALRRTGGFDPDYSLGEDQDLAIRTILAGFEFHRLAVVVAEVREHHGDRLSRTGAADLYDRHAALFLSIALRFDRAIPPLTRDEALVLARTIWIVARNAARDRFEAQAMRLFDIATRLVGPTAAAPSALRPMYRWINPYRVERLVDIAKSAISFIQRKAA